MAKVHFGFEGMTWSGKVGNAVFRTVNGKTYIQTAPDRRKKKKRGSDAELTPHQERFKEASEYGQRALGDPELRPVYEAIAKWEDKPVAGMANRDAYRDPVVEDIDASAYAGRPGDMIAVAASDDTGVVRVDLALADADGEVFETGAAGVDASGWWLYAAQTAVPEGSYVHVVARAMDRPGGAGFASVEIIVKGRTSRVKRPRLRYIPGAGGHPALQGPATAHVTANSRSNEGAVTAYSPSSRASGALDPARLLREARARAGLSQRELARRAGTAQTVVGRIELGQASPSVETLNQLLQASGFELVTALVEL